MENFYCVGDGKNSIEVLKEVNINNDTTNFIITDNEVFIILNHINTTLTHKIFYDKYVTAGYLLSSHYGMNIVLKEDTFITMGLEYAKDNE